MPKKTSMRKELVKLFSMLTERFPECIQYYRDLDFFKSGEPLTKRFPIAKFAIDILKRYEFELTLDCLMRNSKKGIDDRDVVRYEYESPVLPDVTVEIKCLRYTPELARKLKGKKYRLTVSPNGKTKCIMIYSLWHDTVGGYIDKEYSTQNEIYFCQYFVTREKVVERLKSYRLRTKDYKTFSKANISIDALYGMKRFTITLNEEDMCIFEGSFNELDNVLALISKHNLWNGDYDDFYKVKSIREALGL